MSKNRIKYLIITILFIFLSFLILHYTNFSNNVAVSKSIQIIIILALCRISYGCVLYIRRQYNKNKYSYETIMNLGLLLFLIINIFRQINLLIVNWNNINMVAIYNNTISSFSYFAMLTLPCILVLSIYSIISNIVLIKKEGFSYNNLLGILLGSFAILGLLESQGIYILTLKLLSGTRLIILKKLIDILINVMLSYLYSLIIATLYCNIKASLHIPKYDKDYVIILGCMIKKDGTLTPLLKSRVDKAIDFANNQKEKSGKDVIFVPSGGQGKDEITSEAEAIKNYLIEKGINKKNILIENKSTSTYENMSYSKKIINDINSEAKISFSTTNYHVFRSGVIANKCGINCEGMGSKTKWYFYNNALIREFVATLVQERKKHISLLLIMNIFMGLLVFIGYYYNLFV